MHELSVGLQLCSSTQSMTKPQPGSSPQSLSSFVHAPSCAQFAQLKQFSLDAGPMSQPSPPELVELDELDVVLLTELPVLVDADVEDDSELEPVDELGPVV